MPRKLFHAGSTTVKKGQTASPATHQIQTPMAPLAPPPVAVRRPAAPIGQGPANQSGYFHNNRKQ